ncbi:hypothetical protein [Actinobacillus pleuropneumoniae]|uniref:hypothetical protein n=1 Tax=Actinobacillus pleuropneumoniae TaxID=715 RepID=UPI003F7BB238
MLQIDQIAGVNLSGGLARRDKRGGKRLTALTGQTADRADCRVSYPADCLGIHLD